MSSRESPVRYVIDTHAWHWYLQSSPKLGSGAQAALKLVEAGEALLLIPAIVLAEFVCLCEKLRIPSALDAVSQHIADSRNMLLIDTGLAQLQAFEKINLPLEMHDRLILADALLAEATLITRDRALQNSGLVPTIW